MLKLPENKESNTNNKSLCVLVLYNKSTKMDSLESEELQNKQENEGQVLIAVYPWNVLMCVWPVCERQCAVDTQ
jgi:hypothetical protein